MNRSLPVIVGIDNGGTTNNVTVLDDDGRFLVDRLIESPSRVREGPEPALDALTGAFHSVLLATGLEPAAVVGVGLDTPGPASADGVISIKGSTNFEHPGWQGFDIRGALSDRLGLPVTYLNDGNAAALYAHRAYLGAQGAERSSVSVVVGTGLGGGLVQAGQVISGTAGMAGELGHVRLAMDGLLEDGQPVPVCGCGNTGDAESIASLTGIRQNLLPYWLSRHPGHPLRGLPIDEAARQVRDYGERGDVMALRVFEQQATAIGRLFTVIANVTDPDVYLLGGGVVETDPRFRDWFLARVREHTALRAEQAAVARFALTPDRDMAGARGAALAARAATNRT
ncbi:ROK family protein [Pilimelia columellifera]|uniref:ROK family glucokinase n=1 Tax=Pilimelia columellifera subsp. columellifera TaxID=706583 RepID=A0ABP6ALX1_9ACTN